MKPTMKQQLQSKELQREVSPKIVLLKTDQSLYEKLLRKPPRQSRKSGDQKMLGYDGLWGEWIASEKKWTEGRFYVSSIRGYPVTGRMSLAKAWMIRCLRIGELK